MSQSRSATSGLLPLLVLLAMLLAPVRTAVFGFAGELGSDYGRWIGSQLQKTQQVHLNNNIRHAGGTR